MTLELELEERVRKRLRHMCKLLDDGSAALEPKAVVLVETVSQWQNHWDAASGTRRLCPKTVLSTVK